MEDFQGELLCAAANSNAIYLAARDDKRQTLVLVKTSSNNAANIAATAWEVVTARPLDELWAFSYIFNCAVNEQGAFLLLSPYTTSTVQTSDAKNRGAIFDPASGTPGKPATWQRVDAESHLACGSECDAVPFAAPAPSNQQGPPAFVIASKAGNRSDTVNFLSYDAATWSFPLSQVSTTFSGAPDAIIPGTDRLTLVKMPYVSENINDPGQLRTFMLDDQGFPTGQASTFDLTPNSTDCRAIQWQTGSYFKNTLYYTCESMDTSQFSLYTFDGQTMTKTGTATPLPSINFLDMSYIPFPASGNAAPTWAFRHDITSMYGISISGATAGQWQNTSGTALRIDPDYNVVSYPNPLPTTPSSGQDSDGDGEGGQKVSGGAIAGIVIAFVVVIAAAVGLLVVRRRRRQKREAEWKGHVRLGPYAR